MLSLTIIKLIINTHHFRFNVISSTFNLSFYNGRLSFELIFTKVILVLKCLSVNESINERNLKKIKHVLCL